MAKVELEKLSEKSRMNLRWWPYGPPKRQFGLRIPSKSTLGATPVPLFRQFQGEVQLPRITIPRTPVNKGKKEGRHVPAHHPKLLVAGKRSQNLDFVLGGDR